MREITKQIIHKPSLLFMAFLGHRGLLNWMSDKEYIKIAYKIKRGRKLDLDTPQSFSEKLQWLKLYDRKPIYNTMVDKYEVKQYVSQIIGPKFIIPTYGVWNRFEDIDFDTLPNQFVLKCTHNSGGVIIVKDKYTFDIKQAKKVINKSLHRNFYSLGREWAYKDVKPRIIAEKYMEECQKTINCPNEFQFWCFNGEPKFVSAIFQPHGANLKCTYDMDWNRLPFVTSLPSYEMDISKPKEFDNMLNAAKMLCSDNPFLRVDFLVFNEKVYFGELTKYPAGGIVNWDPPEMDIEVGKLLNLNVGGYIK